MTKSNSLIALQSNLEYIGMSGSAKMFAIALTYPYQVVRSRLQVCILTLCNCVVCLT
jgi:solute carrier family 25 folate transporter 32